MAIAFKTQVILLFVHSREFESISTLVVWNHLGPYHIIYILEISRFFVILFCLHYLLLLSFGGYPKMFQ